MSHPHRHHARHRSDGPAPAGTRPGPALLRRAGIGALSAAAAAALVVPLTSAALPDAGQTAVHVLASAGVGATPASTADRTTRSNGTAAPSSAAQKTADKAVQKKAVQKKAAEKKAAQTPQQRAGLTAPLSASTMTSSFGRRVSPITGQVGEFHTGQDFGAAAGTSVKAAGSGTVKEAGWHAFGGGNRVVIDHGNGLWTSYNHMSRIDVHVGEKISRGDAVGAVGSTGASTGPHLHFGVYRNGSWVDPLPYLRGPSPRP